MSRGLSPEQRSALESAGRMGGLSAMSALYLALTRRWTTLTEAERNKRVMSACKQIAKRAGSP